jgi:hypothetical protein
VIGGVSSGPGLRRFTLYGSAAELKNSNVTFVFDMVDSTVMRDVCDGTTLWIRKRFGRKGDLGPFEKEIDNFTCLNEWIIVLSGCHERRGILVR